MRRLSTKKKTQKFRILIYIHRKYYSCLMIYFYFRRIREIKVFNITIEFRLSSIPNSMTSLLSKIRKSTYKIKRNGFWSNLCIFICLIYKRWRISQNREIPPIFRIFLVVHDFQRIFVRIFFVHRTHFYMPTAKKHSTWIRC